MVMGANIGTTVTATLVSMAHIGRKDEFGRAFPIAICHDIFNILTVMILLPLELMTGYLRTTAIAMAGLLGDRIGGMEYESPLSSAIDLGYAPLAWLAALIPVQGAQAVVLIGLSAGCIFVALFVLVKVLRSAVHSRVEADGQRCLAGERHRSHSRGLHRDCDGAVELHHDLAARTAGRRGPDCPRAGRSRWRSAPTSGRP